MKFSFTEVLHWKEVFNPFVRVTVSVMMSRENQSLPERQMSNNWQHGCFLPFLMSWLEHYTPRAEKATLSWLTAVRNHWLDVRGRAPSPAMWLTSSRGICEIQIGGTKLHITELPVLGLPGNCSFWHSAFTKYLLNRIEHCGE